MLVRWHGDDAKRLTRRGGVRGLNVAAEALLGQSQALTPVDTGDLRRSGTVFPASVQDPTAVVAFRVPYAAFVHEGVDLRFRTVKNPRAQAKFLEQPLRQNAAKLAALVAREIRREFGAPVGGGAA